MQYGHALVTGGLGFIGSAIVEALCERGTSVTIVDSLAQNVVPEDFFAQNDRVVNVVTESVTTYLSSNPDLSQFDVVVHAASLVGPAGILRYAGRIAPEIVGATSTLVEACVATRVPLIYFSSAEIYGKNGPLSENDEIRVPPYFNARIEYALAKLTCESIIANSARRGLQSIVIRPFNVVGSRQSCAGGFVLPTFIQQALQGQSLTIFGSGEQVRAFLGLQDLVEFACDHCQPEWFKHNLTVNLGNPNNTTTIAELARSVIRATGSRSRIMFTSGKNVHGDGYEEAESFTKTPNIDRAVGLGWRPKRTLSSVIADAVTFYRSLDDERLAYVRSA